MGFNPPLVLRMMYILKLIASLFEELGKVVKAWQALHQSALHKAIVNKVDFLVGLLPAALATIILIDFLAVQLDILNILDVLPEWIQLIFAMPAVIIIAFGSVGLLVAMLLVPIGYYWTYRVLTSKEKNSKALFN
jgi:hypothetical protein